MNGTGPAGRRIAVVAAAASTAGWLAACGGGSQPAARLTVTDLARALVEHGAQSAVELDINPSWVAGYVYGRGRAGLTGVPVVLGQLGVAGAFLSPYGRDFFAVVA